MPGNDWMFFLNSTTSTSDLSRILFLGFFWRSGLRHTQAAASSSSRPLDCLSTDETISQKSIVVVVRVRVVLLFLSKFFHRDVVLYIVARLTTTFRISKGNSDPRCKIGLERVTLFSLRTFFEFSLSLTNCVLRQQLFLYIYLVFTVSCLFVIVLKKIVITIIHATSICVIVLSRGTQFILMVIIKMNCVYIQLTFEKKPFIAFAIGFF